MLLYNANVLGDDWRFTPGGVRMENGRIAAVGSLTPLPGETAVDLDGDYLIPGLVETHFHGAMGEDADSLTPRTFETFSRFEASRGVTTFVPGLSSNTDETVDAFLGAAAAFLQTVPPGAKMAGVYLEGPFIAPSRKGGHNPAALQLPSAEKLKRWQALSGGIIKKTVIAPELAGAEEAVKAAVACGMAVEIGHSSATYEQAMQAVDWGATVATHTFNGMEPLHHREPGVLGAVLTDPRVTCELIADFGHVAPAAVKLVLLAKGCDKVNLISDSMVAAGYGDGVYRHWDGRVLTVKNGLSYTENGTITGSACTVMEGVRNLTTIGIPLEQAVKTASYNPARTVGLSQEIGSIASGKRADLVRLDRDLQVKTVWVDGKEKTACI